LVALAAPEREVGIPVETVNQARRSRRRWAAVTVGCTAMAAFLLSPAVGQAQVSAGSSSPSSGTLGPTPGQLTTTFDPVVGADAGGTVSSVNCTPGLCSQYALTVKLAQPDKDYYQGHQARLTFHCAWDAPVNDDIDCELFSPSGGQTGPGHPDTSDSGPNFEDVIVNNPESGAWTVVVEGAQTVVPTTVTGTLTLTTSANSIPPAHIAQAGDPHFVNFDFTDPSPNSSYQQGKDALGRPDAGEPSIGIDPATGKVMYMAGNQVTQITYDNSRPPVPTPTDVTPSNSQVNEDAILFTDRETHRTWALGLLLAGSYLAYSDDDGATWTPSVAFSPPAMPDHETLGSGPYHGTPPSSATYPHAVYYCAQTIVQDAYCGRSDDGGMTFSAPATPLWNGACSPIHGHVRVGPTGIVYVPNGSCTDANGVARSGVAVSVDNGASFKVSMPPDSSPGTSDPSVMEGPDGTVYLGYQASNGHPMMATATHDADGTLHWRPSVDVGQMQDAGETEDGLPYGVQNTEFAEVITGDPGRAAFAFLGTGKQGGYQEGAFDGVWYLFISYTFDGGRHWRTINATPHDPVQRGCVWNGGLVNACRNMLDFNDIGIDKQGRVYVAYTDGCTTTSDYSCDNTPGAHGWNNLTSGDQSGCQPSELTSTITSTSTCTFARVSAIVRQVCGRGLIATYDPGFNDSPACGTTAAVSTRTLSGGGAASSTGSGVQGTSATALPNTGSAPGWPYGMTVAGVVCLGLAAARRRRRLMR
jgi:hypothetical protein